MKRTLRTAPVALIALALLAPAPRLAADAFSLDLGVHGGALGVKDSPKGNKFVGGVQARATLVWLLAAEARASYYTDSYDVSSLGGVDVKNTPIQLSAMLYLLKLPKVGLYLLGGGTYNAMKLDGTGNLSGSVTQDKWAAHAGAGLDLKISKSFILNVDGRYVFLNIDPTSLPPATSGSYKGDYWTLTGGLLWRIF